MLLQIDVTEAWASRMYRPVRIFQLVVLLGFWLRVLVADCPRLCECKWKSGKESVICLSANLSVVPMHLDAGTQILDLTANNLVAIKHDEFSQAGLLNLQKIYVSKCRLKTIDRYAFRNLINLVELDLSYNALAAVPSHALDSIPELRELKLSGNPIQRVGHDAFVHVPQLVRLEMSDCKISSIETRAFKGLDRSLEWLKLDKNKLVDVGASSLTILENLHGLELAGNPWNCSCGLRPLREWMVRRNVPYGIPPVCQQPKRLQARPWDKLDLDEFACVPEIFAYDSKAHGIEGRNVTMTCRITGIPEPNVRWMLKNKVIANLSGTPYSNGKKLYIVHLENSSSDLTILAADVQDAGVYVCAAENKAGRVEASVTLAVSRKPPDGPLGSKALLISVIAGVLFVLSVCLVSLCVFTLRKKNMNRWRNRTCRSGEDDYEKIEMGRKPAENANGRVNTGELALVSRKNGDYRVVPGADTDQEQEEDDDDPNHAAAKKQRETTFWNPPLHDTKIETQWDSGDRLIDNQEDLHIPRRSKLSTPETRDDLMKNPTLTSGTYNAYQMPSTSTGRTLPSLPISQRSKTKEPTIYTSTFSTDLSSLLESDEKKYPDLIENSPNKSNNNFVPTKANSEGGSVNDINELFCTLPRKRALAHNSRYTSTDSQSPLLADSRYGSSGGESSSSSSRRLSDPHKYPNLNKTRVNHANQGRSNSYMNLTGDTRQRTSVPPSPIREREMSALQAGNCTPLLDIAALEHRIAIARQPTPSPSNPQPQTTNLNTYDYHAAQLERFLEEYRTLQKELTRMKETCDNMRQDKYLDPMHNSLPVSPSTSEQLKPTSPNSNNPGALSTVNNFDSDLTRYLLKSSPKSINNSGLFNN
ncbi:uncharacterized protein kek3 isoform X2 [Atheta coriaria]|uniref:uncharacterized protein kek3 isoform X2 n=1 Tax=Dalotia coriaria TaxID=877792 RepID=UPI0031F46604